MSLSSESDHIGYSDIRINGIEISNPRIKEEECIDFFVLFKERNEKGEPGVHISIPLDKAKELANAIYDELSSIKNHNERGKI